VNGPDSGGADSGGENSGTDDADERRRIRDAMDRLLAGTPLHSDGKLTVKSLAAEASVKRWLLTHKHLDLQDEFRARVAKNGQVPDSVQAVLAENAGLQQRVAELSAALAVERETVKRLERVVQVLTLENESFKRNEGGSNLRSLKPRVPEAAELQGD